MKDKKIEKNTEATEKAKATEKSEAKKSVEIVGINMPRIEVKRTALALHHLKKIDKPHRKALIKIAESRHKYSVESRAAVSAYFYIRKAGFKVF